MRSIARSGLLIVIALAFAVPGTARAGANLVPNPGFEESPTDPQGATTHQPLLPTGWTFEGAAALFDHSENGKHSGKRMAAISVPASTPDELCQQQTCVDNPLNVVQGPTSMYYSVTPFWRTINPVPVTPGTVYAFSVWHAQSLATVNVGGAITKVRWVDANGLPVTESNGPRHIQQPGDAVETSWALMTRNVTAPALARGAIIMLGAADDTFISQIKFDDVSFSSI